MAALPWNDVNFLVVTDVHSWVAGHPHEPLLDAGYGHVLSLFEHLSAAAAAQGRDLFLVQNGDLNDGTGFSRKPPAALVPLLQRVPFDALTTGNHELYENENIDHFTKPGGFIESWRGAYLTANTLNASTGAPLGARHKLLVGRASGVRVLAFGFLYDMTSHDDHVVVVPVEQVVREAWFVDALNATRTYDALLFLTHMGYDHRLVDVILAAARAVVGAHVPIQFMTGHTHVRAYRALDARAAAFEAGHYLDTVGFASFALSPPPTAPSTAPPAAAAATFAHRSIDANQASMAAAAGLDDPAALLTPAGAALEREIARVASELGLERVLGCAPRTYRTYAPFDAAESLWRLYVREVTPRAALSGNASRLVVQGTGSLRYDLYAGPVRVNDVWTMNPFADQLWRVAPAVRGDDMQAVLSALGARAPAAGASALPAYAATMAPLSGAVYELWTLDFDLRAVVGAYEAQTGARASPVRMLDGENTTALWMRWVEAAWPCPNASAGGTAGAGGTPGAVDDGSGAPQRLEWLLPVALVALLVLLVSLLALLLLRGGRCRRRCCRRTAVPIRNVRFIGSAAAGAAAQPSTGGGAAVTTTTSTSASQDRAGAGGAEVAMPDLPVKVDEAHL